MTVRPLLLFVPAIVLAGGILFWPPAHRWLFGAPSTQQYVTVSGNIEAHQSVLSFAAVQAPIIALPFDEGRFVRAGTELARVDARLYQQQLAMDLAGVAVARKQLDVDRSNLLAAGYTVRSDRFDLVNKRRDAQRNQAQLAIGAASQQASDLSATQAAQAAQTLAHDQALVAQARHTLALAQASLKSAEARAALDRVTLSYTVLRAPFSGVLSVREAELGELAGPGVAIFTLDDLDHVWLRAYINETNLGQIRLNEPVEIRTDTWPDKIWHGRIGFIASEAEFTPKTVETHAERVTLVYRIRIDISNPSHQLLPGMPAEARI
ncbi:MAG: efflux RND transporter periplasmic adaptor subunit, partial [Betaproteobacteria bacterium]|nr:efflux RND transporter periplasmic adaptor subunit [Betaproteobacteria bacterium]